METVSDEFRAELRLRMRVVRELFKATWGRENGERQFGIYAAAIMDDILLGRSDEDIMKMAVKFVALDA